MAGNISRRDALSFLTLPLLTSCTMLSPAALLSLGSKVDTGPLDFAALREQALRTQDAHKSEAEIRAVRPQTVAIGDVAKVKARYVLERDDRRRVQYIFLAGSLNLEDWLEDFDIFFQLDQRSHLPLHRGLAL